MHSAIHANQTAHYIITGRIVRLTEVWLTRYFLSMICMYESTYVLNMFFNAPRTCCCWWLCLEVKKGQKAVRTRGFVRFINTVHLRETVEKQRFRSCPEKKRENRTKPRFWVFIHTAHRGEKTVLYGFPYGEWSRTVEKTVQRGTAPNRTVRYITAPTRTVGFMISENRTEPHRRISDFGKPHLTAP